MLQPINRLPRVVKGAIPDVARHLRTVMARLVRATYRGRVLA